MADTLVEKVSRLLSWVGGSFPGQISAVAISSELYQNLNLPGYLPWSRQDHGLIRENDFLNDPNPVLKLSSEEAIGHMPWSDGKTLHADHCL